MPIKKIASALFLSLSLSGCSFLYDTFVYQIDVTQGNYIDNEKISQLEVGMSQEQVIFILGSPMLIDQFDSSKWYYLRYIKPGGKPAQQQQIVLQFDNKTLINIEKEAPIAESPLAKPNTKKSPNEAAENSGTDSAREIEASKSVVN